MPEYRCSNCGAIWCGWGLGEICNYCGNKLVPVNETANERIEEIEDDISDLKLKNKVNEYKEKYPEHFKE